MGHRFCEDAHFQCFTFEARSFRIHEYMWTLNAVIRLRDASVWLEYWILFQFFVFVKKWLNNYSTSMAWVTLETTFHSQVSVQLYDKATQQAASKHWSSLNLVQKKTNKLKAADHKFILRHVLQNCNINKFLTKAALTNVSLLKRDVNLFF